MIHWRLEVEGRQSVARERGGACHGPLLFPHPRPDKLTDKSTSRPRCNIQHHATTSKATSSPHPQSLSRTNHSNHCSGTDWISDTVSNYILHQQQVTPSTSPPIATRLSLCYSELGHHASQGQEARQPATRRLTLRSPSRAEKFHLPSGSG